MEGLFARGTLVTKISSKKHFSFISRAAGGIGFPPRCSRDGEMRSAIKASRADCLLELLPVIFYEISPQKRIIP